MAAVRPAPLPKPAVVIAFPTANSYPWTTLESATLAYCAWMGALDLAIWSDPWARHWFAMNLALALGVVLATRWQGRIGNTLRPLLALWVVLPLAYNEAGNWGTRLVPSAQAWLIHVDLHWFGVDWMTRHPPGAGAWSSLLELAYVSNYALIMGGMSALIVFASRTDRGRVVAQVWGAGLAALLLCYAFFPLIPAVTPRLYFPQLRESLPLGSLRGLNHLLLARFSVPWGIFPSGHVAGPVAIGAAFLGCGWRKCGLFYLAMAALIGIATVHGNYHFVCDALGGAGMGVIGCLLAVKKGARSVPFSWASH